MLCDPSFLTHSGELSRLPLAGLEALHLGSAHPGYLKLLKWNLGSADSPPGAVSEVADRVHSLFRVLARTRSFFPESQGLRLSWSCIPSRPVLPIVAATDQLHILDLILSHWDVDGPTVQALAESQPLLQKLTLASSRTSSATWAAMPAFPCLKHLNVASTQPVSFLDEDFRQLVLLASNCDREMTLTVNIQTSVFDAFKTAVMGGRQVLGKTTWLTILNAPASTSHIG